MAGAILLTSILSVSNNLFAQNPNLQPTDSISTTIINDDKNVMLNASSTTGPGPRNINIGLPAGTTGSAISENGLPVAYALWPLFPTHVWRLDAATSRMETYSLNQTALKIGDVGIFVGTFDNLGTDKTKGSFSFNTNQYGLLNGTGNISGPLNKKGLLYSAGVYINNDPGTLDMPFEKYYSDKTQLAKVALTQKYNNGRDKISVLYKFMNRKSLMDSSSPFYYNQDGSVDEIPGVTIGRSSFYERSGKLWVKDLDGTMKQRDLFDHNRTTTNEIYVIGENTFRNNWKLDYTLKYSQSKTALIYSLLMNNVDITGYQYQDTDMPVASNTGYMHLMLATPQMTLKTLSGIANLNRKTRTHSFDMGVMVQVYNPGTFYSTSSQYITDISENPQIVSYPGTSAQGYTFDENGYITSYNTSGEYFSGYERKLALYATDDWNIIPKLNVKYGARLEMQRVKGNYAPKFNADGTDLSYTARNDDGTFSSDPSDYYYFNDTYLNVVANAEAVYKLTRMFGFTGEVGLTTQSPKLESYGGQYVVDPKQNVTTTGGLGIYFNHPFVELVSKATYIKKTNYVARMNFRVGTETVNDVVYYGIETMGWTTDFLFHPFHSAGNSLKNLKLHFLFTMQAPKYKDYTVSPTSSTGEQVNYSYNDKTVTTVSKYLMEIDPSYSFAINKNVNANIWLSARYYSKQYANLPNNLFYAAHWETFGGVSVKYKNLEFTGSIQNILNQKGLNGVIGGTDLYTQSDVDALFAGGNRPIYAASYIRPFSAEFGVKYSF